MEWGEGLRLRPQRPSGYGRNGAEGRMEEEERLTGQGTAGTAEEGGEDKEQKVGEGTDARVQAGG